VKKLSVKLELKKLFLPLLLVEEEEEEEVVVVVVMMVGL
jgi:hypothetical protein